MVWRPAKPLSEKSSTSQRRNHFSGSPGSELEGKASVIFSELGAVGVATQRLLSWWTGSAGGRPGLPSIKPPLNARVTPLLTNYPPPPSLRRLWADRRGVLMENSKRGRKSRALK